jgi:hypothetical protein
MSPCRSLSSLLKLPSGTGFYASLTRLANGAALAEIITIATATSRRSLAFTSSTAPAQEAGTQNTVGAPSKRTRQSRRAPPLSLKLNATVIPSVLAR